MVNSQVLNIWVDPTPCFPTVNFPVDRGKPQSCANHHMLPAIAVHGKFWLQQLTPMFLLNLHVLYVVVSEVIAHNWKFDIPYSHIGIFWKNWQHKILCVPCLVFSAFRWLFVETLELAALQRKSAVASESQWNPFPTWRKDLKKSQLFFCAPFLGCVFCLGLKIYHLEWWKVYDLNLLKTRNVSHLRLCFCGVETQNRSIAI